MLAASNTLPDNAGYVAAAYLVFLALLLIYVGIMAYKLIKVQQDVAVINELADRVLDAPSPEAREREETIA
jgi:phosphoribosylaminoimidazole carboxylase (NCAIR synthetase)